MKTAIFLWITIMTSYAPGSRPLPTLDTANKQDLFSFLLQAPPVVEVSCYVRDVNSGVIIVNKICECEGTTVDCDVGPIRVGDIELTFCNKKPTQSLDELLVLKFACDSSDPSCGEGTACDIGPIEYNSNKYYLCTYQTGILPPAEGADICQPAANRTVPPEPSLPGESKTTTAPGESKNTNAPGESKTTTTPGESKNTNAPGESKTTNAPGESKTTYAPGESKTTNAPGESKTTTTPGESKTTNAPGESKTTTTPGESKNTNAPGESKTTLAPEQPKTTVMPSITWRPWNTPTWVWPPVNPPRPIPTLPPIPRTRPPVGWGRGPWWHHGGHPGFRFWWRFRHVSRWDDDDDDDDDDDVSWPWGDKDRRQPWGNGGRRPWDDDDGYEGAWGRDGRFPCRQCGSGWQFGTEHRHGVAGTRHGAAGFRRRTRNSRAGGGWPWNQRGGRTFSSESSSSSSDGWW